MNRGGLAIMATTLCAASLLAFSEGPRPPVRLAYNATESAAVGFYAVAPVDRLAVGDQVLSRLPPATAGLADRRRYIPVTTPVLKTVAAMTGTVVCRSGGVVSIDARPVAWARPLDRAARLLPVWSGCHRLGAGEVFLLGRHPDSFDGRYFGPTAATLIVGKARPLWTW
jgi:type IV secretory pathway protease TraF